MFLLKVKYPLGYTYTTDYYEYSNEEDMLAAARKVAENGAECTLFKPYKKFEKPKPTVVEVDV